MTVEEPKIYVVNLARSVARRHAMVAVARRIGVDPTFVEAVDGTTLSPAHRGLVDREARLCISPFQLTDGEIACWLSHRRALEAFYESGAPLAVIMEDDALPLDGFNQVLAALVTRAETFDLVTLHRNYRRKERFVAGVPLVDRFRIGRVLTMQIGNVGYVVSRAGAARLLDLLVRPAYPVDKAIHRYWANGLDIYGLSEPVVAHDDAGHSFIDETIDRCDRGRRLPYPEANAWRWRLARKRHSIADSIAKRFRCFR